MSELIKLIESEEKLEFVKLDKFLEFINQSPPDSWIQEHPLAKGVLYLPIEKVELLLKRIFQEYRVEILREGQLLNALYVTVRLHYKHPIIGWTFQDGTGAMPIQVDKGKNASELQWIKSDAVPKGLPAAVSFAIKDAADRIGDIFGGNLNRKYVMDFKPMYTSGFAEEARDAAIEKIKAATSLEDLRSIFAGLGELMRDPEVVKVKDEMKGKYEKSTA